MEPIRISTTQAILYVALFNMALGALFGLAPLIFGFIKKERSYAVFGFLGAIIGGGLLGIFLSIPIAAIFTWLILRKTKLQNVPAEPPSDSDIS